MGVISHQTLYHKFSTFTRVRVSFSRQVSLFSYFFHSNPAVCCFDNFFAKQRNAKSKTPFCCRQTKKQRLVRSDQPFQPLFWAIFTCFCCILPRKARKNLSCLGRQKRFLSWRTGQDSNLRPTESESVARSSWATGAYAVNEYRGDIWFILRGLLRVPLRADRGRRCFWGRIWCPGDVQ